MFISFDIGASKTRVGISLHGEKIIRKHEYLTISDFQEGLEELSKTIQGLTIKNDIQFISGSIAAVCSKDGQDILSSTRLTHWVGKPLAKELFDKFKVPVFLMNDAVSAALCEAVCGAGRDKKIVVYLTVSTGINGACVTDGVVNPTCYNFQFGHQIIVPQGKYWKYCGQYGCLEAYASGLAFYETFGIKPEHCFDPIIWDNFSYKLALGIVNIITMYSPEIVVVGGGISKAGKLLFKPLIKHIKENLKVFSTPPVVPSSFGDNSGLLGGFIVGHQKINILTFPYLV